MGIGMAAMTDAIMLIYSVWGSVIAAIFVAGKEEKMVDLRKRLWYTRDSEKVGFAEGPRGLRGGENDVEEVKAAVRKLLL